MNTNTVYNIDNLNLMQEMEESSIDLIYSDILYNTGKKFKDYNDSLGSIEEVVAWYKPRLVEMQRILKPTGCIFLQMDWRIEHYIKVLMDEVFGYGNFRNQIIWRYKRWTSPSKNKLQAMHDVILFYSKDKDRISLNHQYEKLEHPRMYQNRKGIDGDVIRNEDGTVKYYPQTDRQIDDVWEIPFLNPRAKERVGYDTQKPLELAERIIKIASNEGDLVADFFCGSGTTLVAAKKHKRFFIGCDTSATAVEITNTRLRDIDMHQQMYI